MRQAQANLPPLDRHRPHAVSERGELEYVDGMCSNAIGRYEGWYAWELDYPPLPEGIHGRFPFAARWFILHDPEDLPENNIPGRPMLIGYVGQDDNTSLHAHLYDERPRRYGHWTLYKCRICARLFASQKPPNLWRKSDCGCVQHGTRRATQTSRFEGEQVGKFTICEYQFPSDGFGERGGWVCVCDCGNREIVSTIELRMLRKLACRECCPEEYTGEPGRKAKFSQHGKLLREYRIQAARRLKKARMTATT